MTKIKDLPKYKKVEMFWGDCHDIIDVKTRKMFATLYTLVEINKDKEGAREYFNEYCNLDIDKLDLAPGKFISKKAKDGIWDVIVNVKKFDKRIFKKIMVSLVETH